MSATTSSTVYTRSASDRITLADGSFQVQSSSYKRIVVCCDGTWQGSDKAVDTIPSNVARLVKAIAPKKRGVAGGETQQVVYYQSGVGSSTIGKLGNVAAGATGAGLDDNVLEAYYYICNNYEVDDEIFAFGFSRGAYTVRTLCGLLDEFGIIDRYSLHMFPEIYKAYQKRTEKTSDQFTEMYEAMSIFLEDNDTGSIEKAMKDKKIAKYEAKIKVIGCFDTVGSMGIPENALVKALDWNKDQKFRDPRLSIKVENAFHALALDEHRQAFTPTLWHTPIEARDKDPYQGPNLVQCWFPGVHINVGGGNTDNKPVAVPTGTSEITNRPIPTPEKFVENNSSWTTWLGQKISNGISAINVFSPVPEKGSDGTATLSNADNEELADITLMWMVDRCRPFLEFNDMYLNYLVAEHEKKTAVIRKAAVARISPSRLFGNQTNLNFGYACGPIMDSYTGVMALGGSQKRAPGQYTAAYTSGNLVDDTHDIHHTNEYMHQSVRWRFFNNGDEYKSCRGLDGFKLVDYSANIPNSPVSKDMSTTGMVWEKPVKKPAKDSGPTIRVSEFKLDSDLVWTESERDPQNQKLIKVERRAESMEYKLMGQKIWESLRKGQSYDTEIKGKAFFQ